MDGDIGTRLALKGSDFSHIAIVTDELYDPTDIV